MIDTYIHPTAVIDNGAIIGNGCHIWHFVHIINTSVVFCEFVNGSEEPSV